MRGSGKPSPGGPGDLGDPKMIGRPSLGRSSGRAPDHNATFRWRAAPVVVFDDLQSGHLPSLVMLKKCRHSPNIIVAPHWIAGKQGLSHRCRTLRIKL